MVLGLGGAIKLIYIYTSKMKILVMLVFFLKLHSETVRF